MRQPRHVEAEARNRALWDELAHIHMGSYLEVGMLRRGEEILDPVELEEVGAVGGRTLLHLQCHIGTDTLAWARHGAIVTGVDFSQEAVTCAELLSAELGIPARFVRSNVYDAPQVLSEQYDIVYTSRGVLCWLTDIREWARIVARLLRPGGFLYLLDSHPMLYALEEQPKGLWSFEHPYFHDDEPTAWSDDEAAGSEPASGSRSHVARVGVGAVGDRERRPRCRAHAGVPQRTRALLLSLLPRYDDE